MNRMIVIISVLVLTSLAAGKEILRDISWRDLDNGGRFFSRTLANSGGMKMISVSSGWREFVIPAFLQNSNYCWIGSIDRLPVLRRLLSVTPRRFHPDYRLRIEYQYHQKTIRAT